MTLILSCLTDDCVLQVSDRRLSQVPLGKPIPGDFNKAVCFTNRLAVAYTGLARLDGQPTDAWLARTLAKGDDEQEGFNYVKSGAAAAVARSRAPSAFKSLTFVGIGWDKPNGHPWCPWFGWLSNVLDKNGSSHAPRPQFVGQSFYYPAVKNQPLMELSVAGEGLRDDEYSRLVRDLRKYVAHSVSPALLARRLTEQVREVACRRPTVSQDVMITSIPRIPAAFESGDFAAWSGEPSTTHHSFLWIPAGRDDPVELGPRVAWPGGMEFFDYQRTPLKNPGDFEVVVGIRTPRNWG